MSAATPTAGRARIENTIKPSGNRPNSDPDVTSTNAYANITARPQRQGFSGIQ